MTKQLKLLEIKIKNLKSKNRTLQKVYNGLIAVYQETDETKLQRMIDEQNFIELKIDALETLYKNEFELEILKQLNKKKGDE